MAGKRRYYRPDDVALLRRIRQLLYEEGYTIRGVQKLIREKGVRAVLEDIPDEQNARCRGGRHARNDAGRGRRRARRHGWRTGIVAELEALREPRSRRSRADRAVAPPSPGRYNGRRQRPRRLRRSVAQPGSASHWGCGGRRFKSCRSDQPMSVSPTGRSAGPARQRWRVQRSVSRARSPWQLK